MVVKILRKIKGIVEGIILPKVKVKVLGKRIHHSYIGLSLILFTNYFSNSILLALGSLLILHDLICHIIYFGE